MRLFLSIIFLCVLSLQSSVMGKTYRLQVGDKIEISVWQDEKLRRVVVVRPDGKISFPLAGHMRAQGSTVEALEARIKQRLGKYYNKDDLDVTVLLAEAIDEDPKLVYVTGEVLKPGAFSFKKPTTILQAIALSGGLGPFAAAKRIQVRRKARNREVLFRFNYDALENGGDLKGNIYLRDGDVIVVPERGLFE